MKHIFYLVAVVLMVSCAPVPNFDTPYTPTATSQPTQTPTPTQRAIPCARVVAQSLHIRFLPDYHANVAGWFIQDTALTIRNDSNPDWYLVNGKGIEFSGRKARITGYVKSEWIQIEQCEKNVQSRNKTKRR